jgi:DNA-binding SARP family transcriptional activator/DNA-binding beta-propeller fold protein YncE
VQAFVSRLRRALGDEDARRVILTKPSGYVLQVAPDDLDLTRFETLVSEGRSSLSDDRGRASNLLRDALALWRGPPLSDVALEPFARHAIPRLEELRLQALEDRVDADLALGRHAHLVAELRDLVTHHPLRERPRAQLMLALYRSGRQAEALETYREGRDVLVDQLGVEPGPELQRLESAILRQDPSIELPVHAAADAAVSAAPAPTGRRRRPLILAGTAVLVAVTAGVTLLFARSDPPITQRPDSVAAIQPSSGDVVADIPVGSGPKPLVFGGGSAWAGNQNDHTVTRIDPGSRTATQTFGLADPPVSLTYGDGYVWIGDGYAGTLSRILAGSDQLLAPFYPGAQVAGLLSVATSPKAVWVGTANDQVVRLAPGSLQRRQVITLRGRAQGLAWEEGSLWSFDFGSRDVEQINPSRDEVSATVALSSRGRPDAIAAGFGAVWVTTLGDDRLWQIDPSGTNLPRSVPLGIDPGAIAVGGGAVWVSGTNENIVDEIDPATATLVRTIRLTRPIGGIAFGDGVLWLTLD